MKRVIIVSFPENKLQEIATIDSILSLPYELVELIRKDLSKLVEEESDYFATYLLSDIMPIHNFSGVRDLNQIKQMQGKIAKGEEILEKDGLPNIKLVVAPNGQLLIFDGTHTLMAYLLQGKKLLSEIPYLVISAEKCAPVSAGEISIFFPVDSREQVKKNWNSYVVNWQAKPGLQAEKREFNSMGELALEFGKRYKGAVEH